jgi:2-polyprenyl-3-methyl-5-hydroxy-6-metoxy-1,4-benzoquinol methylase
MKRKNENFVDLAEYSGSDGRRDSQSGWQAFIGRSTKKKTILDVGSGLGNSRHRLQQNENLVTLLEPAPNMPADICGVIDDQETESYDITTAFDVIEHIEEDEKFLENLFRVCRDSSFLSTPNFNVFGCKNKYHIREYKPEELADMCLAKTKKVKFFVCTNTAGNNPVEVSEEDFRKTMAPALGVLLQK